MRYIIRGQIFSFSGNGGTRWRLMRKAVAMFWNKPYKKTKHSCYKIICVNLSKRYRKGARWPILKKALDKFLENH